MFDNQKFFKKKVVETFYCYLQEIYPQEQDNFFEELDVRNVNFKYWIYDGHSILDIVMDHGDCDEGAIFVDWNMQFTDSLGIIEAYIDNPTFTVDEIEVLREAWKNAEYDREIKEE